MRLPRRSRVLAVVPLVLAAVGIAVTVSPPTAGASTSVPDWPQYHGGAYRAGDATSMPTYKGGLKITKQIALDGAVYAQPIVADGLTIVATENDTVYAFDANNNQVWSKHLGTPTPTSSLPCGDINPLGITGTPVYYAAAKRIYLAAEVGGTTPSHELFGLSVTNGATQVSANLDLPGVGITPAAMQERGALALSTGRVWVPFGGLAGDCSTYRGRLVGVALGGSASLAFTVPTSREGGIWTPPGATVDPDGNLFVSVGNGAAGTGGAAYDYSDSVLKISGSSAARLDSFSPSSWRTDNDNDLDLGSQGPAFVRGFVFSAGKSGNAYILRRTHLGGIGGQVSTTSLCSSFGGTAVVGNTVFVPCTDGVRAVYVDPAGKLHGEWRNASAAGAPVYGGGIVWSLDSANGVLQGIGVHDGARHVSVTVGSVNRFATPAISGRRILVGTLSGLTVLSF